MAQRTARGGAGGPSALAAFLWIERLKGECTDGRHTGWFEILSFSWGASQPAGSLGGEAAGRSRADFEDLVITKLIDSGSPGIYSRCAAGTRIPKVLLEACHHTGGEEHTYFTIKLEDAVISSVRPGGSGDDEGASRPIEEIGFRYSKISWEYAATDHAGKVGATGKAGWDLKKNESYEG